MSKEAVLTWFDDFKKPTPPRGRWARGWNRQSACHVPRSRLIAAAAVGLAGAAGKSPSPSSRPWRPTDQLAATVSGDAVHARYQACPVRSAPDGRAGRAPEAAVASWKPSQRRRHSPNDEEIMLVDPARTTEATTAQYGNPIPKWWPTRAGALMI